MKFQRKAEPCRSQITGVEMALAWISRGQGLPDYPEPLKHEIFQDIRTHEPANPLCHHSVCFFIVHP